MKYLVIVESPAKEKTISKILGKDYLVKSSFGHIRDLPKSKIGIDIEDNFKPTYIAMVKSKKVIADLKKAVEKIDHVYLATDFDREGEAIAWHLKELLKLSDKNTSRITFHEITEEAITSAVKTPRKLDMALVDSQQARRILDRLVGYKLSPLLWKKIRRGLSAGRVQSVAVMMICDREEEINKFVPVEYWSIIAELQKTKKEISFKANLVSKDGEKFEKLSIQTEQQSTTILEELENAKYKVLSVEEKERKRSPYGPYTTSTMQQDVSRRIGFSPSKTMMVAQKLYEGINIGSQGVVGLITYMRTDSLNVAKVAQEETLKFIETDYGKQFLPKTPRFYKTKSKGAQEAHEAIRPTSVKRTPEILKQYLTPDEYKLYNAIWCRFVASQMADSIYDTVGIDIGANNYVFRASGSTIKFEGFMKVYIVADDDKQEPKLPKLLKGDNLELLNILPEQHFTEPPPRYNEASLIKSLEEHGIGRPSTYAPTIKTILDRLYVRLENKKFYPTDLGTVVNNFLKNNFKDVINYEFTADIEEQFDEIAENKIKWQEVIKKFYDPFSSYLTKAEENTQRQKIEPKMTGENCPKCGKPMLIRDSRRGQFMACSGYPECKTTFSIDKDGNKVSNEPEVTEDKCPKCGGQILKKRGFRGPYLACEHYPECKTTFSIDKNGNKVIKPEPEVTDIKCEKCGSPMLKRIGKRGPFLACSAFPKCRNLQWIKQDQTVKKVAKKTTKKAVKKKK
ncbi:MAG: type I DNA topoisomerase [Endomicrobiaceae bacterium]|nr:type I DNA topoisomerase [Endomicrobiaceae bacterium]MDD3052914.1 type I DNA topoisomerase [Endomicrobiaceae bacterium]MDD3922136.1 type I DNA topoisomerase [Endomicrobiaceae bacterium]MDD5102139.1 type I DNA topoisomerase [Endomicrobiaceae bacterium]